jgi:hypothetical protein
MRQSYIMTYAAAFAATHSTLTNILDQLDPQCDWHAPFPQCLFFTSHYSAPELALQFESRLGTGPGQLFLISEVLSSNKQGRLTERGWRILNNPDNARGS